MALVSPDQTMVKAWRIFLAGPLLCEFERARQPELDLGFEN